MYEVEVKVRGSHETVRAALAEQGAKHAALVHQVDTYYNAPHRDFAETDEALRIRTETDANGRQPAGNLDVRQPESTAAPDATAYITYKGPLVDTDSKTRTEFETTIESPKTMDDILSSLGFWATAAVVKNRERYTLGEYTVTLDTVAELGEFIEIETTVDDDATDDIETAREEAFSLLRELGLDPTDQIRTSYLDLLLDNNRR